MPDRTPINLDMFHKDAKKEIRSNFTKFYSIFIATWYSYCYVQDDRQNDEIDLWQFILLLQVS